jgi:hypothetical protein
MIEETTWSVKDKIIKVYKETQLKPGDLMCIEIRNSTLRIERKGTENKKVRIIFEQHKLHRLYDVFIYFTIINFGTSIKLEEIREDRNDNEYFLIDEYLKHLLNDTFKIKKNIKENRRNNSNDYKYGLKRIYRRKNRQGVVQPTLVEDIMQFHKKIKKRHDQKWKFSIITKMSYYSNIWLLIKEKIRTHFSLYH